MSVTKVSIRTSTRGKNPRILTYEGIGKVQPFDKDAEGNPLAEDKQESKSDSVDVTGIVTTVKDAVELVNGDLQTMLDCFADGFNLRARASVLDADEFAGLLDGINWTAVADKAGIKDGETEKGRKIDAIETVKGQFKRMARTMSQQTGDELAEVVSFLSRKMPKVETESASA